ncbi:MAG: TolC family protein [Bacteriovoracaceae bacterium]|nr:TolC family protein [Bacteriovoracaceae bacterium]
MFIFFGVTSVTQVEARKLSLPDLIDLLADSSITIKQQNNNIVVASKQKLLSWKRLFLPHASLSLSSSDEKYGKVNLLTDSNTYSSPQAKYQLSLGLSYNLFTGFKDQSRYKQDQWNLFKAKNQLAQITKEEIFELTNVYLKLGLEKNKLLLITKGHRRDKELMQIALDKYKKGLLLESDYLRGRINFLSSKKVLLGQQRPVETLKIELQRLVGDNKYRPGDIIVPFAITSLDQSTLKLITDIKNTGVMKFTQSLLTKYEKNSFELKVKKNDLQIAQLQKTYDMGDYFPQVSLESTYNYFNQNLPQDYYYASVAVTIPIFDSFDTTIKKQQNVLKVLNASLDIKKHKLDTKNTLIKLLSSMLKSYEVFVVLEQKYKLQKKVFEITFNQFKIGTATTKDVIDDKIRFNNVGLNLAYSNYELREIKTNIEYIVGKLGE